MDIILEIFKLILKQERNFQTKKVIDQVYKDLGKNDMTHLMSHP
jgi:flagellar biosynthesis/type III secretory pathway protein FliH